MFFPIFAMNHLLYKRKTNDETITSKRPLNYPLQIPLPNKFFNKLIY